MKTVAHEHVRAPAVAGTFYPGERAELAAMVDAQLADARSPHDDVKDAVAFIMPHAGYVYSGPVAATGYRALALQRDEVKRVVVFGPCHREFLRGMAVANVGAHDTPLGRMLVDDDALQAALTSGAVQVDDLPHRREHSLEVQLPFIQRTLGDLPVLLIAVGSAREDEVADVMERVLALAGARIIVSSDLSHYLPYDAARDTDKEITSRILSLQPALNHEQACGATPVNGLLKLARRRHLDARLLDCRNSGDTAGDRSRVVGYATVAFVEGAA